MHGMNDPLRSTLQLTLGAIASRCLRRTLLIQIKPKMGHDMFTLQNKWSTRGIDSPRKSSLHCEHGKGIPDQIWVGGT
jgi:hypothetical protein